MKVFIAHPLSESDLVEQLVRPLRTAGHEVFGAADVFAGEILSQISSAIRQADVVVAVLTTSNPNVYYEVGLATGANVPLLLVASGSEALPADLATVPYLRLTGSFEHDAAEVVRRVGEVGKSRRTRALPEANTAEEFLTAAANDPAVLEALSPSDFETLIVRLFEERGLDVVPPSSRDEGFDFMIDKEHPTLVEIKKRKRQSLVSVETVRALLGALTLAGASQGLLISSSGFTAAATALASRTPISLMTLEDVLNEAPGVPAADR